MVGEYKIHMSNEKHIFNKDIYKIYRLILSTACLFLLLLRMPGENYLDFLQYTLPELLEDVP